jgi:hypothetical protein
MKEEKKQEAGQLTVSGVSYELLQEIKEKAREDDRSISNFVVRILKAAIRRRKKP